MRGGVMLPRGISDFAGRWRIDRQIVDRKANRRLALAGSVDFVPDDTGLICEERGMLDPGDGSAALEAVRRYLWRPAGPGRIGVRFEDGRPFHHFELQPRAEALHRCPPDLYRAVYDFSAWPEWSVTWAVTGPRKDYESSTRYLPVAASQGLDARRRKVG